MVVPQLEGAMERIPKAWMFTLGLSVLAVTAALIVSTVRPSPQEGGVYGDDGQYGAQIESCFRYGRLECCVKGE
jgi:hypothetical protein